MLSLRLIIFQVRRICGFRFEYKAQNAVKYNFILLVGTGLKIKILVLFKLVTDGDIKMSTISA